MGIEKDPEVVKNIVKQVVHNDASLDTRRQSVDELIVFLNLLEAVVRPKVLEVLVDLAVKTIGQRLVFPEAGEQCHPVVKLEGLFHNAKVAIEVRDDLDK